MAFTWILGLHIEAGKHGHAIELSLCPISSRSRIPNFEQVKGTGRRTSRYRGVVLSEEKTESV